MLQHRDKDTRLLLTAGMVLLAVSLASGFVIHLLVLERLAMSAHLVGLVGSVFLVAVGAIWPRLNLSNRTSALGSRVTIYAFWGSWIVYFLAAATGAGGMFPILAGDVQASPWLEDAISLGFLTVVLALAGSIVIILRGLWSPSQVDH
jgi:hypothetical protein